MHSPVYWSTNMLSSNFLNQSPCERFYITYHLHFVVHNGCVAIWYVYGMHLSHDLYTEPVRSWKYFPIWTK